MEQIVKPSILTATELMEKEFPPPEWLIEGLLPEGLTVLSGAPKIGKSWLSLQLALAVTTGRPIFGRAPASEKGVLLLALEDNERRLKERITKCGITPSENFCITTNWKGGITALRQYLLDNPQIKVCIIDTLAVFLPSQGAGGRTAYDADVVRMRELHDLIQATKISLIVIHHDKQGDDPDWASKMSGSNGITGTADTLIRLSVKTRGSKQAKLEVTGRDVEDLELNLKLDETNMSWQIDKGQNDKQLAPLQIEVLKLVPAAPETIRSREIADRLGKEQSQISEILKKLANQGRVFSPSYSEYSLCPY